MFRVLAALFVIGLLAGCGSAATTGGAGGTTTSPPAMLTVKVWADGSLPELTTREVPAVGVAGDFAPTAADVACTEIYGGPGKATVTGTLADGTAVDATFSRANGCEIARWERMVALGLIPSGIGGVTAP